MFKLKILSVLLCFAFMCSILNADMQTDMQTYDIVAYIQKFVVNKKDRRYKKAIKTAEQIMYASKKYDVPHQDLTVILRYESSFYKNVKNGKAGEHGMGQFWPGGVAMHSAKKAGLDLRTWKGQIEGVALWYKHCLDKCNNDTLSALNAYQTKGGSCKKRVKGAGFRYRSIQRWPNPYRLSFKK